MLKKQDKQLKTETPKLPPTIQDIKHQILQDSFFLKNLKDSLKKR